MLSPLVPIGANTMGRAYKIKSLNDQTHDNNLCVSATDRFHQSHKVFICLAFLGRSDIRQEYARIYVISVLGRWIDLLSKVLLI